MSVSSQRSFSFEPESDLGEGIEKVIVAVDLPFERDKVFRFIGNPKNDLEWWKGLKSVDIKQVNGQLQYHQLGTFAFMPIDNIITVIAEDFPEDKLAQASITLKETNSGLPWVARYIFTPTTDGKGCTYSMVAYVDMSKIPNLLHSIFKRLMKFLTQRNFNNLRKVLIEKPELLDIKS